MITEQQKKDAVRAWYMLATSGRGQAPSKVETFGFSGNVSKKVFFGWVRTNMDVVSEVAGTKATYGSSQGIVRDMSRGHGVTTIDSPSIVYESSKRPKAYSRDEASKAIEDYYKTYYPEEYAKGREASELVGIAKELIEGR